MNKELDKKENDNIYFYSDADRALEQMSFEKLEYMRQELIKDGEDTDIIDRAIQNKKTKEEEEELEDAADTLEDLTLLNLLYGKELFGSKSNKTNHIDDEDYEEEELEDDDYYSEDDV